MLRNKHHCWLITFQSCGHSVLTRNKQTLRSARLSPHPADVGEKWPPLVSLPQRNQLIMFGKCLLFQMTIIWIKQVRVFYPVVLGEKSQLQPCPFFFLNPMMVIWGRKQRKIKVSRPGDNPVVDIPSHDDFFAHPTTRPTLVSPRVCVWYWNSKCLLGSLSEVSAAHTHCEHAGVKTCTYLPTPMYKRAAKNTHGEKTRVLGLFALFCEIHAIQDLQSKG